MPGTRAGVVSVVLINFRGTPDTIEAVKHLDALRWPADKLEIVIVENGSGDDSAAVLAAALPHVNLVVSAVNHGFAGGCNLGVAESSGEYVAFLNNDAKPHPDWVAEAVAAFESSPAVGAVASKVLDWEGERVDFIGAGLTWFGMGYKPFTGEPFDPAMPETDDVLFGTGSAMFVRRSVFEQLGGFDERFFMFFEDVDFGWRLNLAGYRYAYAPLSIAFHKHHASMSSFGSFKETYLLERNALFTLYKNIGADSLGEMLPAAMALAVRRGVARGGLDSTSFDIRTQGGDDVDTVEVAKETAAGLYAIDQFVENLPSLAASRAEIQATRVVSDSRIWRLFGETDAASFQNDSYLDGYMKIASSFDVLEPARRTTVLVVTGDPIGVKLAGPAIRAWNIANALSADNDVRLVSLTSVEQMAAPFDLVHVGAGHDREFQVHERWADVIVFQGQAMELFESLRTTSKIVVADIYDPMHLEQLEQAKQLPRKDWENSVADATAVLNEQLGKADFFVCASERQRMFYLGQLAALGRVNPANYAGDPDLRGLVDVVPFGLPRELPAHDRDVLKGALPGIAATDKVLLWSGGLYNWFDPQSLIRAVAELSTRRPNVRLFFQGTKHPHPGVPEMEIVKVSRDLASSLGVLDTAVFFNRSWVDYADRHNYLIEADAGVSTHFDHLETTMSFRTRILDYLWAGLPMVVTEGDVFAELVEREGLGIVVPANNVSALADALERILYDDELIASASANIARVRENFYWDRVLEPLVRFVAEARHAPDMVLTSSRGRSKRGVQPQRLPSRKSGLRHNVTRGLFYLRNGGPMVVVRKVQRRLKR